MPKAAKSGTSSEAKSTRNKDKHYSREKKKSGVGLSSFLFMIAS